MCIGRVLVGGTWKGRGWEGALLVLVCGGNKENTGESLVCFSPGGSRRRWIALWLGWSTLPLGMELVHQIVGKVGSYSTSHVR